MCATIPSDLSESVRGLALRVVALGACEWIICPARKQVNKEAPSPEFVEVVI
jgi:hypothetical protein